MRGVWMMKPEPLRKEGSFNEIAWLAFAKPFGRNS